MCPNKLRKLAKQYCPTMVCGLSKGKDYMYDFPTAIYTHPFSHHCNGDPVMYYKGWKYGDDLYLMYALFHRMDKNHEFDFEGALKRIVKNTNGVKGKQGKGLISVSHFGFKYNLSGGWFMTLQPGSHGITPAFDSSAFDVTIRADAIHFIPMLGSAWDQTVKEASPFFEKHGVKWPWQWNSFDGKYRIRQWARRYLKDNLDGLIWHRPDLLFKIIEQWDTSKRELLPELREYIDKLKQS